MSLSEAPPEQYLPPDPPAIVEAYIKANTPEDIGRRFQELATKIFDGGLIANKTEQELMEITANLVIAILAEQQYMMSAELMFHYYGIRERIVDEKWRERNSSKKISPMTPKKWLAGAVIAWVMTRGI